MLIFGGLYFAQGVPWGFCTVAIALHFNLSSAGLGDLSSVAWLPGRASPYSAR